MSKLIGKGTTLVLQIVFVVALVLVFSWFDPFSLLAPTKRTLKHTPIQIQSIREIGQLITAEYYGEVIASLKEVIGKQEFDEMQEFNYIVDDLHENFKMAISDFAEEDLPDKSKSAIFNSFETANADLKNNSKNLYNAYLYYIFEKIKDRNYKKNDNNKELSTEKKQTLIKRLYLDRFDWRKQLMEIETDEFKKIKKEKIERDSKKTYRHTRLVMIGRGWVKAGFDFREFNEKNFKYDKNRKRIHFIGLKPQIISATINPWFIPEEGVEGFEFLIAERGARLKPEYTKMVKQRCLDKLQKQAMDKKILERTQKNAETQLKAFFSLIMDDEISGVYFHTDFLDYTLDVILSDSLVRNDEIYTIDSAIVYFNKTYVYDDKFERISDFISSLNKAGHEFYGLNFKLNTKSSLLFSLIQDRMIDSLEILHLENGIKPDFKDSIWYKSDLKIPVDSRKRKKRTEINSDSIVNVKHMKDMNAFCTELSRFIHELPMDVDTSELNNKEIYIKINNDTCKIILQTE